MNNRVSLALSQVVELDLSTVVPCCSGPKRPQDRIPVSDMKKDFESCLGAKVATNTCKKKYCFLKYKVIYVKLKNLR